MKKLVLFVATAVAVAFASCGPKATTEDVCEEVKTECTEQVEEVVGEITELEESAQAAAEEVVDAVTE